ncbi:YxiG-like protein [Amycolatopsis japonica]|uniref:YxiG-like protein n=1 Tax=Amycolatopsis japonica TaxID=208439 RepID=UPI003F4CB8A4
MDVEPPLRQVGGGVTRTGDPHATNGESARITDTGDRARGSAFSSRPVALVFHGFADYMRDYDVLVYATADPRTGIRPEFLRYRFKHCVRASVTSAVTPETWSRSLDDRLVDFEQGRAGPAVP